MLIYCYNYQALKNAGLAHLVERHLAKVEVASSSLVTRSNLSKKRRDSRRFLCYITRLYGR